MLKFPRRIVVWGGAVAVAGAGFAYLSGNTVDASSAGDGASSVSGYTVSNVKWAPQVVTAADGTTQDELYEVQFDLTSVATSAPANAQPRMVVVYTTGADGKQNSPAVSNVAGGVTPPPFNTPNGSDGQTCGSPGWGAVTGNTGAMTGHYTCLFYGNVDIAPNTLASLPLIGDVHGVDVEANQ